MTTLQGVGIHDALTVEGLDTHDELTKEHEEHAKDQIMIPLQDENQE